MLLVLDLRLARRALDLHQLAGVHHQARVAVTEGLGHHLLGPLQVVARIDEVGRGTHRRRRANALQDGRHAIRMRQRILTGVQALAGQQGLGKGPRTLQCRAAVIVRFGRRLVVGRRQLGARQLNNRCGPLRRRDGAALHAASRNSRTTCTWSGCCSVGAWPTPANSTSLARGPRCVIACAVSRDSRSDSAPRNSKVGTCSRS